MCMFSGEARVASTRIFARFDLDRQVLAYQMKLAAAADVAMVLPLPVRPGSGDDAVGFIDLSEAEGLFDHLDSLFPKTLTLGLSVQSLEVHRVGMFEASYVPSIPDFARLDRRFQLAPQVWNALPQYRDFGFAVFKLASTTFERVHPMAFTFPTRAHQLFFPTVHVHDGQWHRRARFDHELYCQLPSVAGGWESSWESPDPYWIERSRGVLGPEMLSRLQLHGTFDNADVWV